MYGRSAPAPLRSGEVPGGATYLKSSSPWVTGLVPGASVTMPSCTPTRFGGCIRENPSNSLHWRRRGEPC